MDKKESIKQHIFMQSILLSKEMEVCNTYDFTYTVNLEYAQCHIFAGEIEIIIVKRPGYCDRGRYGIYIES